MIIFDKDILILFVMKKGSFLVFILLIISCKMVGQCAIKNKLLADQIKQMKDQMGLMDKQQQVRYSR